MSIVSAREARCFMKATPMKILRHLVATPFGILASLFLLLGAALIHFTDWICGNEWDIKVIKHPFEPTHRTPQ